jgi:hypothetical protein
MPAKAIEHIQGDSYGHDFTSPDIPIFDADWSGKWSIVSSLGKTALLHGTLAKSTDLSMLMLRIRPGQTDAVPVGTYQLVVQVDNPALEFRKEILQNSFKVMKQGIPP